MKFKNKYDGDVQFKSARELKEWLVTDKRVNEDLLGDAALLLFQRRYITTSSLMGISFETLKEEGISNPVAMELSNKLEKTPLVSVDPQEPQGPRPHDVLPSAGTDRPKQSEPRKTPSSEDGQFEGLLYASIDSPSRMECSSTPACVQLLQIFEDACRDQVQGKLDPKFLQASEYFLTARRLMSTKKLPADVCRNERFLTGAMVTALNTVLNNGFVVLHEACLGPGTIHSGVSACRIKGDRATKTLLVGEGLWNCGHLRNHTRGRLHNELLRHRLLDHPSRDYSPILLLAFDHNMIEVDVVFPSTKGGKMEKDGLVQFSPNIDEGTETFWSVRLIRTELDSDNDRHYLPALLCFFSQALLVLDEWPQSSRVQFKMPLPLKVEDACNIANAKPYGDNVTIIQRNDGGPTRVYKEYCYHLREDSTIFTPRLNVSKRDQRQPPNLELLEALGHPYSDWKLYSGPFGMSVLRYDYIDGISGAASPKGWLMILGQIKAMHSIHYVHGDLLPRNVVFVEAKEEGYVIDFDMSRKEGEPYVVGYNHGDFKAFRHKDAYARKPMLKEHDVHSLCQMSKAFFQIDSCIIDEVKSIEHLEEVFREQFFALNPEFQGDY